MNDLSQPIIEVPYQEASLDIWDKKYRLKKLDGTPVDNDIRDMNLRIAQALANVEISSLKAKARTKTKLKAITDAYVWALENGAVPAGRILSNAGAQEYKPATSLINCTVSQTVPDSMYGILETNLKAGMTLKSGAGIGYDFSTLRPKGAFVRGAGSSTSGPLSFMDIFDKTCETVSSAGGRRGAQMGCMDIGHPDILDFIRAKREAGKLRKFNLSVLVTRDFVDAVENDREWDLAFPALPEEFLLEGVRIIYRHWPVTEGYTLDDQGRVAMRVYRTLPARRLWDVIMTSTYDFAEPGFILIDEVNEMNNNWFCETIRATNPCVTGDTWVLTTDGPRQVYDLVGKQHAVVVDGRAHLTTQDGFFKTGVKPIYEVTTKEGFSIRLTEDHLVLKAHVTRNTRETEWVKAGDLQPGDLVVVHNHREFTGWEGVGTTEQGYLLGLLVGDGVIKKTQAILSVWEHAGSLSIRDAVADAATCLKTRSDHKGWFAVGGRGEHRFKSSSLLDLAKVFGMEDGKGVTPEVEKSSPSFYRGFLRGFFDADGSVQGSQEKGVSVRLSQSNAATLKAVQRMLARLGIVSSIYLNRRDAQQKALPDGKGGLKVYPIKAQHELVVANDNLIRFADLIGFADSEKQARLIDLVSQYRRTPNRERFVAVVETVSTAGEEDVFDVQVPGINAFDANGLYVHNCGEQPLPPNGSCLLGSVLLTKFVKNPFTPRASFDWEKFRKVVKTFTRMLDNVPEINGLPLEAQREEILSKRRHGMGYLGLGSAMAMLCIPYGSDASLEFTEKVTLEMAVAGWEEAVTLAQEKGPAPALVKEYEVTPKMMALRPEMARDGIKVGDKVPGRILHAKYSRYMQRLATVQPELVEKLASIGARFTHHTSIAPTGTISLSVGNNASNGIEPSFSHSYARNIIRPGKKTKEKVDVLSYEFLAYKTWIDQDADPNALPEYFTTATVSPKAHIDVQAAAQKCVDSSISKTINVPTDFPYEAFKDIYLYAAKKGLKGCTTFRYNPENFQGVLVNEEDLKNTVYRFTTADGKVFEARGDEEIFFDGETHTAANLYDALKEGYFGKL